MTRCSEYFVGRYRTVVPVFELNDEGGCVRADVAALRVKAGHHKHCVKAGELCLNLLPHGVTFGTCAGKGRTFRKRHRHAQNPLVFARDKARGRAFDHLPAGNGHRY